MEETYKSATGFNLLDKWIAERLAETEKISAATTELKFVRFTEKEVHQMPKSFRKSFRSQGCTARIRKTVDNVDITYEIIYAKKPFNKTPIRVKGATLNEAKAMFIAAVWGCAEAGKWAQTN